mgnify:FL=1
MTTSSIARSVSIDTRYVKAYIFRGETYSKIGQFDRAIEDLSVGIALTPEKTTCACIYTNRGFAYYNKGQPDKAVEDFNKAISLNPKYTPAYISRGIIFRQKGLIDKAMSDFQKACDMGDEKGCDNLKKGTNQM